MSAQSPPLANIPTVIPLSARAVEVIEAAKALGNESDLVFPSLTTGKALSDMTLSKLMKELGYSADVRGLPPLASWPRWHHAT